MIVKRDGDKENDNIPYYDIITMNIFTHFIRFKIGKHLQQIELKPNHLEKIGSKFDRKKSVELPIIISRHEIKSIPNLYKTQIRIQNCKKLSQNTF